MSSSQVHEISLHIAQTLSKEFFYSKYTQSISTVPPFPKKSLFPSTLLSYKTQSPPFKIPPPIKKEKKVPVVLSRQECKELFKAPANLKHRFLLAFAYAGGLRMNELRLVKISDVDLQRRQRDVVAWVVANVTRTNTPPPGQRSTTLHKPQQQLAVQKN